jgi:hypothetical protein
MMKTGNLPGHLVIPKTGFNSDTFPAGYMLKFNTPG